MKFLELLRQKKIWFEKTDKGLVIYDAVYLHLTQIEEFPDCPMEFMKDVYLSHAQIKELPKCSMIFNGGLNISYTPIKELPVCIIKGNLHINGTPITKIPKDLKASCIYTSINSELDIYIEKNWKIRIGRYKKNIKEWVKFFKKREPFDNFYYPDLTIKDYNLVEQDFKNAVKLLKSWIS